MRTKRVYLRGLRKYDEAHDECLVRSLEMTADQYLTSIGYSVQFWRDVQMYGVDEAILYVENGRHGNAAAIRAEWAKLRERMSDPCEPLSDSLHPEGL